MNKVAHAFSQAANNYADVALQQQSIAQQLWQMAPDINAQHVLDIGCGPGGLSLIAQKAHITGIDVAFGMCQEAHKKLHHVAQSDACVLPFKPQHFTAAFSALCWQWIEQPQQAASEIFSILKPGAKLLLATYHAGTLHEIEQAFSAAGRQVNVLHFRSMHHDIEALQQSGFSITQTHEEVKTLPHEHLHDAMHYLRHIGAHTSRRASGLMTPRQYQLAQQAYTGQTSWHVGYIVAEKTA